MSRAGEPPSSSEDRRSELDESLRLASLPRRLRIVERIMAEAILDPRVEAYRRRAQFTFFLGASPDDLAGYSGQLEAVGRCLEWFVFDYVIPELETTPALHWFDGQAERLSAQDRQDARDALRFVVSLFEVKSVEPGGEFLALDLLRAPLQYRVAEAVLTHEMKSGQLIVGRLFPHRGAFALSGMAVLMNPSVAGQLRALIRSGQWVPAAVLKDIDGVELENLFDRRLQEVDEFDLACLRRIFDHYVTDVCSGRMSMTEFEELIDRCPDGLTAAAEFADRMEICGRHEMDLVFTGVMAFWQRSHAAEAQ